MGLDAQIGPMVALLTHDYESFRIILACFSVRLLEGPFNWLRMTR